MNWQINNFFPLLNLFRHQGIVGADGTPPWEALTKIKDTIQNFIDDAGKNARPGEELNEVSVQDFGDKGEKLLLINQAVYLEFPVLFNDFGIYIGKGTTLEPTAILKPPMVIGENCDIRQGAYLRGNVIVGDYSTIGHATEIKNSIMMDHSEAGHFAYIGDSIIGSHVNLGAGTKLANLQFRSKKEKLGMKSGNIKIKAGKEILETGLRKFGAVIGDYSELGCNSVTSPGTILEHSCWIYPNVNVSKGVYPFGEKIKCFIS